MRLINRFYLLATILPLLLLVLVPDLRLPAQKLLLNWRDVNPENGSVPTHFYQTPDPDVLARVHNSLEGKIWGVVRGAFPPELQKFQYDKARNLRRSGKMLALANLAEEYPNNALILVQALSSSDGSDGRTAGPWEEDWKRNQPPAPLLPTPASVFTPAELAIGLQLARRGQKLEPQNTYFDWMAARFLFAMNRDAQATEVLIAASHKTGFDVHWDEFWQAAIWSYEQGGPLLPEEKAMTAMVFTLPYLSSLRHVTNMALWRAMQKENFDDVKGALEIEGALARLHMLRCQRGFFGIEQMSGASELQRVWRAPEEMRWAWVFYVNRPKRKEMTRAESVDDSSQQFIRYCNAHGRPDLARESAGFVPGVQACWSTIDANRNADAFVSHMNGNAMTSLGLWWFTTFLAAFQLVVSLAIWLLLVIIGPWLPPRSATVPHLGPRVVFYPMIVGAAFSIVLGGVSTGIINEQWAGGLAFCGFPANNSSESGFNCGVAALAMPFLMSAVTVLVATTRVKGALVKSAAPVLAKDPRLEWENLGFAPESYVPFVWFWRIQAFFWYLALPTIALFCVLYLPFDWFYWFIFVGDRSWTHFFDPTRNTDDVFVVFCGAVSLWFLALLGRWRFGMPAAQRGVAFAGFQALRRAQAWMIPVSLWLVVITLWCALPSRRTVDRQRQQFLQSENQ